MDGDDVRVLEGARRPRLLLEAADVLLVVPAGGEDLDGDVPVELQVVRDEDAAHPAATQLALDPVPISEYFRVHGFSRREGETAPGDH